MNLATRYVLGETSIAVGVGREYLETIFHDGAKVPAIPHYTEEYRAQAVACGYNPDDVWRMCREHEILHTWLSTKLGRKVSPTLWAVAHNEKTPQGLMWFEEELVLKFQYYLNTGERPYGALFLLPWYGLNLKELRREALELLRPERVEAGAA